MKIHFRNNAGAVLLENAFLLVVLVFSSIMIATTLADKMSDSIQRTEVYLDEGVLRGTVVGNYAAASDHIFPGPNHRDPSTITHQGPGYVPPVVSSGPTVDKPGGGI